MKLNSADHSAIAFACLMTFVNEARKSKIQPKKLAALMADALESAEDTATRNFLKHARHWACLNREIKVKEDHASNARYRLPKGPQKLINDMMSNGLTERITIKEG